MKTIDELWKKLKDVELIQVRPEEMEPMYEHCFEFESPVIVEIGSAHGASSIVFASAADELKGDLICIDNFIEEYEGQEKFGDYARKAFNKNMINKNERPVTLYDMNSTEAFKLINKSFGPIINFISILFIDGDHSYQGVKADCTNYLPLLKSGGYVGFHDYNNVAYAGVKKAADEFCSGWQSQSIWDLMIFRKP